jgi:hypothetical protein
MISSAANSPVAQLRVTVILLCTACAMNTTASDMPARFAAGHHMLADRHDSSLRLSRSTKPGVRIFPTTEIPYTHLYADDVIPTDLLSRMKQPASTECHVIELVTF